jgi:hypothetical protein
LANLGVTLIRLRGKGLKCLSELDVPVSRGPDEVDNVLNLVKKILASIPLSDCEQQKMRRYTTDACFCNEQEYLQLLSHLPGPLPGRSFADLHPRVAAEWHPVKNGQLTPRNVAEHSNNKSWWICKMGHSWRDTVAHRASGRGCPYCCSKRVCDDNCLQTLNPRLAKRWDDAKNGKLAPRGVTKSSSRRVWWICERGHSWKASVSNRDKGSGCPFCAGQAVDESNCLLAKNPALAKEWDSSKNGTLAPARVTSGSSQRIWWHCAKSHSWQASIVARNRGAGCPYCSGLLVTADKSLAARFPGLATEWHPAKNGTLTPNSIASKSNKKVWWICEKGHEWQAVIYSRSEGCGCRECARARKSKARTTPKGSRAGVGHSTDKQTTSRAPPRH